MKALLCSADREQSNSITVGLRVTNFVVPFPLKCTFYTIVVPLQLLVTTKHRENVAVISSITWYSIVCIVYGSSSTCFILLESIGLNTYNVNVF